ncbi:hypothetical protein GTW51_19240 [Aurantimonas aggregata]|uniref:Uncharacterized protein n=1 Tax=Aurantimonas aggregata TaxID=2047720 RepID=A0A6L9MM82_9HYPH|nr:hypothetical protein [Aurantimonas aggregata]NDV88831.1 hypothetical protein [Aurantimonas aggregata]
MNLMIRRLLSLLFGASAETRQEARVLIVLHGPERAWLRARDKLRMAGVVDAEDDSRYWRDVMLEIERRTGYRHDKDTA